MDLEVSHLLPMEYNLLLPMAIISSQPFYSRELLHTGFSVQKDAMTAVAHLHNGCAHARPCAAGACHQDGREIKSITSWW